ncbi:MAG TPA: nuclear transport factor 2 family protein [Myxococcota bacterium]
MHIVDRYREYAAAFEATYLDDDWSRLEQYFAKDVVFRSYYTADIKVVGREAVIEQLHSDVEAFDRKFDERHLEFLGEPRLTGDRVATDWKMTYVKVGAPDLVLLGTETATFAADLIVLLEGAYVPDTFGEFGAWLGKYGEFLRIS